MTPPPVVLARGLVKRYGDVTAVRGVDFEVAERQCFDLLGPNGAGKTTTMRMIACAAPPSAGALTVLGQLSTGRATSSAGWAWCRQDTNLDEDVFLRRTGRRLLE